VLRKESCMRRRFSGKDERKAGARYILDCCKGTAGKESRGARRVLRGGKGRQREGLVFEDAIPGMQAGKRAGMSGKQIASKYNSP